MMDEIRRRHSFAFERAFGVPLSQYWDDNRGGFQAAPFVTQVLEYEGPWLYKATRDKFGFDGLTAIARILADINNWWTLPF